jgi:hypothetical protein
MNDTFEHFQHILGQDFGIFGMFNFFTLFLIYCVFDFKCVVVFENQIARFAVLLDGFFYNAKVLSNFSGLFKKIE